MGIGTPSEGFECDIYLPRHKPDRDWIIDVCHTLWRHGMTFVLPEMQVGTWEEQLQNLPPFQPDSGEPLINDIDDILRYGFGMLPCYDRKVRFELNIDTDLRGVEAFTPYSPEQQAVFDQLRFGRLEIYVKYPIIR